MSIIRGGNTQSKKIQSEQHMPDFEKSGLGVSADMRGVKDVGIADKGPYGGKAMSSGDGGKAKTGRM